MTHCEYFFLRAGQLALFGSLHELELNMRLLTRGQWGVSCANEGLFERGHICNNNSSSRALKINGKFGLIRNLQLTVVSRSKAAKRSSWAAAAFSKASCFLIKFSTSSIVCCKIKKFVT